MSENKIQYYRFKAFYKYLVIVTNNFVGIVFLIVGIALILGVIKSGGKEGRLLILITFGLLAFAIYMFLYSSRIFRDIISELEIDNKNLYIKSNKQFQKISWENVDSVTVGRRIFCPQGLKVVTITFRLSNVPIREAHIFWFPLFLKERRKMDILVKELKKRVPVRWVGIVPFEKPRWLNK